MSRARWRWWLGVSGFTFGLMAAVVLTVGGLFITGKDEAVREPKPPSRRLCIRAMTSLPPFSVNQKIRCSKQSENLT
jgi:hypothetical protein